MRKLAGKVALITRASNSTGASIAKAYAAEGAAVVLNYVCNKTEIEETVQEIVNQGGLASAIMADITKKAEVISLFGKTYATFGRLDILVNNAGPLKTRPCASITIDAFNRQLNADLLGPILAIQQAIRLMKYRGGSIINIGANGAGRLPAKDFPLHSTTVNALDSISHSLALELASKNIRVNSLNPDSMDIRDIRDILHKHFSNDSESALIQKTDSIRGTGTADDLSNVAVFLASDEATCISGEAIYAINDYANLIRSTHTNIN